jgi:hypothetical protein
MMLLHELKINSKCLLILLKLLWNLIRKLVVLWLIVLLSIRLLIIYYKAYLRVNLLSILVVERTRNKKNQEYIRSKHH